MNSYQKILNQANPYLQGFELAWQNFEALEKKYRPKRKPIKYIKYSKSNT
ncbi:MAG: hypothetical protein MUE85_00910 [Microscillaceae bacterium]|jgi:hypothetical protein|nr:hypothetical protein [Microscillaceae bacterium]